MNRLQRENIGLKEDKSPFVHHVLLYLLVRQPGEEIRGKMIQRQQRTYMLHKSLIKTCKVNPKKTGLFW